MVKLKIGFVGLKFGKTLLARLVADPGNDFFEISAVCDINKIQADDVAGRYPGCVAYYDIDELLKRDDISVIGLFTGPAGRAKLLKKIIDAGKDVMTTKPFEIDPIAAEEILAYARDKGRIIHLNSPSPLYSENLQTILKWQENHKLGRPVACRADLWTSHREKPDGTWHDDPKLCPVAPITRVGIYRINDMLRLFGRPISVNTLHSRIFTERPTPDNAQLSMLFEDGTIVSIFASYCCKHPDAKKFAQYFTLNYENGTIYCSTSGGKTTMKMTGVDADGNPMYDETVVSESGGVYQWEYLYNCVNERKLNDKIYDDEIVVGIRVLDAVSVSEETNNTAKVIYRG